MKGRDQWHERTGAARVHSNFAHNTRELDDTDTLQPGGTAIVVAPSLQSRCSAKGQDPTGLGRWVWTRIQGTTDYNTSIFSAYRPCLSSSAGVHTVSAQHDRHLGADSQAPRTQFLLDLADDIRSRQEHGDRIILGIDINEDVRSRPIRQWAKELNLQNAIFIRHSHLSPPATCHRNDNRVPIDGLFTSIGINVVAAGFLKYGDGTPSDHRVLWADFLKSDIIGARAADYRPPVVGLRASDPRDVTRYNTRSFAKLQEAKLLESLTTLSKIDPNEFNQEHQKAFARLQQTNRDIRLQVRAKVRHVYRGTQHFSPAWKRTLQIQQLWGRVDAYKRRHQTGKRVKLTQIRRLMRITNLRNALTFTAIEVTSFLKAAKIAHLASIKNDAALRYAYLQSRDEAHAEANGTTVEIERKKRKTTERQRDDGRKLAQLKRVNRSPVTKLQTTTDGITTLWETKDEVELAYIAEGQSRFSQTIHTPAMDEWVIHSIGYAAEKDDAQHLLDGTLPIPLNCDPYLRKLLSAVRMPDIIRAAGPISTSITIEDHIKGWRRQKERTASVRSELGFADHIAATHHPGMAEIDRLFRQIPYAAGFSPESYQKITDFAILKKAGIYDAELMRTIQLMVAGFNMNNKLTGKEAMKRAEAFNIIPPDQAGSRKKMRAILHALNKVVTVDLSRQRRLPMALCSNDAKSCYDRIVLWVAALCLRRLGVDGSAVAEMMLTLLTAWHYVTTAFGESKRRYRGNDRPLQGIGQGNGAGPAIWAVISAVLLCIMRDSGYGLNFITATSSLAIVLAGFAFVDDTDLLHAAPHPSTPAATLVPQMQQVVDTWEGLLRATGGALRDDKSYWYLLDYKYHQGRWKYKTKQDLPGDIDIKVVDARGRPRPVRETLTRLEPSEARETLGVYVAMDGNWRQQKEVLIAMARSCAELLRTGHADRRLTWYAFSISFMKSLEYPMEASCLTEAQWDEVMKPLMSIVLQKCGIASTFPRDLVFTSLQYQGLGARHPFYQQELKHLNVLITETANPSSPTGQLLVGSAEDLRLEIGLPGEFTDAPWSRLGEIITHTWLSNFLKFASAHRIRIHDPLPKLQPARVHDLCLMEVFLTRPYSDHELRTLLAWRQYFDVIFLSEIADAAGNSLLASVWEGCLPQRLVDRPTRARPPPRRSLDLALWQRALTPFIISPRNRKLRRSLGQWMSPPPSRWRFQYSPSEDRLFEQAGHIWKSYVRTSRRINQRLNHGTFRIHEPRCAALPRDLCRADVRRNLKSVTLGTYGSHTASPPNPRPTSLDDAVSAIPRSHAWTVANVFHSDNGLAVANALREGSCVSVSDGSFKDMRSTSGFLLEGPAGEAGRIYGTNAVPGQRLDQDSYRGELGGIMGVLHTVQCLTIVHNVQSGKLRLGLDGLGAMEQSRKQEPGRPTDRSFDLLAEIRALCVRLPVQVEFFWIEGHQTERHGREDYFGYLNRLCDNLAKAYWNETRNFPAPEETRVNFTTWGFGYEGAWPGQLDLEDLYNATYGRAKTIPYWQEGRHPMPAEGWIQVDWIVLGQAFRLWPRGKRQWLSKHMARFSATGRVMLRRKEWDHDRCPRCDGVNEDSDHILRCPAPSARRQWLESLASLETKLEEYRTHPDISRVMLAKLRAWPHTVNLSFSGLGLDASVMDATRYQDHIGWGNFLLGRLTGCWRDAQDEWIVLTSTKWKRSSARWLSRTTRAVWEVSWEMWMQRNAVYHDPAHPWRQQKELELCNQIRQTWSAYDAELYFPTGRKYFSGDLEFLLHNYSAEAQRKWLASVAAERARKVHNNKINVTRGERTVMFTWLHG